MKHGSCGCLLLLLWLLLLLLLLLLCFRLSTDCILLFHAVFFAKEFLLEVAVVVSVRVGGATTRHATVLINWRTELLLGFTTAATTATDATRHRVGAVSNHQFPRLQLRALASHLLAAIQLSGRETEQSVKTSADLIVPLLAAGGRRLTVHVVSSSGGWRDTLASEQVT